MAGRLDAQARADQIRAFQEELAQLESELGAVLDAGQRATISAHHDALLADFARTFDVSTTESDRQLALGLRLTSFLGALALCTAVVLFVQRFWGGLTTGVQVGLLGLATALALGLTEFAARREKTLYFAGLAALVAFAAFVTDVSMLGQIFNLVPSHQAFLLWAAFAGALAYGYGLRLLLLAGASSPAPSGWAAPSPRSAGSSGPTSSAARSCSCCRPPSPWRSASCPHGTRHGRLLPDLPDDRTDPPLLDRALARRQRGGERAPAGARSRSRRSTRCSGSWWRGSPSGPACGSAGTT